MAPKEACTPPTIVVACQQPDAALAERVVARLRAAHPQIDGRVPSFETLAIQSKHWPNGVRDITYDIELLNSADIVLYVSRAGNKDIFLANVIMHALVKNNKHDPTFSLATRFRIVEPFNGSCRQDREDAANRRPAFGPQLARLLALVIGPEVNVLVVTPHSAEFFAQCGDTFEDADAIPVLLKRVHGDTMMVAVDAGVVRRWPHVEFGIRFNKVRDPATGDTATTLPPDMLHVGSPSDARDAMNTTYVFIDDEFDSGGTMCAAIALFVAEWRRALDLGDTISPRIAIVVAHASLSGPKAIANLKSMREKYPLVHMYVADTRLERIDAALLAGLPADILTVVPMVEDLLVEQATALAAV